VPVELTSGLAVMPPETMPDPAQLNPVPLVVAAERTTDVVEQVSVPPVTLAPGTSLFSNTDAVAVLVHPPAEVVTVTVYVPLALTVGVVVVVEPTMPGPLQLNVTPGVEELTEIVIDVLAQVSVPPVALALGGTI